MLKEVTSCCQLPIPQTNLNRDLTLLDQEGIPPLWCFFATSSPTKNATHLKLSENQFYLFYITYPSFESIAFSTVMSSRF